MATVTGYTAEHMDEIKDATIVGATVTGDDLILTKYDTTTINAGNVKGTPGIVTAASAPIDTSVLWADTTTTGAAGTVPDGGTIGQVLAKNSATDYDTEWASVGSAARPLLTRGAYLDGTGLVLSGLAGNNASTPDSAALSITGDFDLRVKVALDDWTPTTPYGSFITKDAGGLNRSFIFDMEAGGITPKLNFYWGTGAVNNLKQSTVNVSIADGTVKWLRVTLDVDNGAGGHDVRFYTSDDGSVWTQLGATVTTAGTTSIFDNTASVIIGSFLFGKVHRAIIKNGIDGTTVFDADFSTQTADALAFTESSANAATVSINTTRYFYGVPGVQISGASTQTNSANVDNYAPFFVDAPISVDMLRFNVNTGGGPSGNATVYIAIYRADDDMQPIGAPIVNDSIAVASGATGIFRKQITPTTLTQGNYVMVLNTSVAIVFGHWRGGPTFVSSDAITANIILNVARTANTFTSSPSKWTGSLTTGSGFFHFVLLRYKAAT